jgi:hypothetical protein
MLDCARFRSLMDSIRRSNIIEVVEKKLTQLCAYVLLFSSPPSPDWRRMIVTIVSRKRNATLGIEQTCSIASLCVILLHQGTRSLCSTVHYITRDVWNRSRASSEPMPRLLELLRVGIQDAHTCRACSMSCVCAHASGCVRVCARVYVRVCVRVHSCVLCCSRLL